jgi:hypothetical protein
VLRFELSRQQEGEGELGVALVGVVVVDDVVNGVSVIVVAVIVVVVVVAVVVNVVIVLGWGTAREQCALVVGMTRSRRGL